MRKALGQCWLAIALFLRFLWLAIAAGVLAQIVAGLVLQAASAWLDSAASRCPHCASPWWLGSIITAEGWAAQVFLDHPLAVAAYEVAQLAYWPVILVGLWLIARDRLRRRAAPAAH